MIEILFFLLSAVAAGDSAVHIDPNAPFPRQLSAFRLFRDADVQSPNSGLVSYDVITPLFSDYAEKFRFVFVPENTSLGYDESGSFTFPVGAALIKTFAYPALSGDGLNLIETRVMIHRASGWEGAAYVWDDEQTDALLAVAGKRVPVAWPVEGGGERSTTYFVPNMNQCNQCHRSGDEMEPLGFRVRHVNRDGLFNGDLHNQLDYFAARGLLRGAPPSEESPRAPRWDDVSVPLDARVRAYLDINCAPCHNPKGLASHTDLDLTYTQNDPNHRGILKRPTSAGRASMDLYFAIKPGDPDRSFLLQRLLSTEPAVRMPQISRTVVHEEGVALIREWIVSLGNDSRDEVQ